MRILSLLIFVARVFGCLFLALSARILIAPAGLWLPYINKGS